MRLYHAPTVLGNNYTIDVEFADDDPCWLGSTDSDVFTVLQEDARTTYTGKLFASTVSAVSGEATVLLAATICDISNTADAAGDTDPGSIANATVTFVDRNGGPISPALPVILLPGDTTKGTVTYVWNVDIGAADAATYDVGTVVGNYYLRDSGDDDVEIMISKPGNQFATGGGFIVLNASFGTHAGDIGSNCNFGFNAKFKGVKKLVSGEVNINVRRTETDGLHQYQIKGLNIASLGVNPAGDFSEFCGMATIRDLTDAGNAINSTPYGNLIVKMEDNGNPGSLDRIAIALYAQNGGLIFSSNWGGTATLLQNLDGGNINIHGSAARSVPANFSQKSDDPSLKLEIISGSYPNPFNGKTVIEFTLPVRGVTTLEIVNVNGEVVHAASLGMLDSAVRHTYDYFAQDKLESGVYFYRIISGDYHTTGQMTLIK
jgi:hypothetical protein